MADYQDQSEAMKRRLTQPPLQPSSQPPPAIDPQQAQLFAASLNAPYGGYGKPKGQ